jgi:RNA polymerase sigma-70 factor (ECF subfamily)
MGLLGRLSVISRSGDEGAPADGATLVARTDDELMLLARGGVSEAFDALVRRHQGRVLRLIVRQLGSAEPAADVAQNAFLAIFRALPRYQARGQFTAYLYRAVLNECRYARRTQRARGGRATVAHPLGGGGDASDGVLEALVASTESAEAQVLARERARDVEAAVAGLSDKLRDVVSLRYTAGLDYEEIARTLAVPLGTVKRRLFDAMEKLRRRVEVP